MTRHEALRNVPASIRQRLLNLARKTGAEYDVVLQRFAIERFLVRLGTSDEVNRSTLKRVALFNAGPSRRCRLDSIVRTE